MFLKKFVFDLTLIGYLNFIIIQWFFVRIAKVYETKDSASFKFKIMKNIKPLTGWWNEYKYSNE